MQDLGWSDVVRSSRIDTATDADWSWMEDPLAVAAVEEAAKYARRVTEGGISYEQAFNDGAAYISVRPEIFTEVTYDAEGVEQKYWKTDWITYRLRRELSQIKPLKEDLIEDYEQWESQGLGELEGEPHSGMQAALLSSGAYTRELAASLIEAMYNEWVIHDEHRPDSDMPRAKPNPAHAGGHIAHKIDIERSWARAPLDQRSKLILAAVHGHGWTHKEIGAEIGISGSRAHKIADEALGILVATLNGAYR